VSAPAPRGRAPLLGALTTLVYLFLYAPILVLVVFSFNRSRLTAVWGGFTLDWYARLLSSPQIRTSLRNSLVVALVTTVVATVIGTAAALALARGRLRQTGSLTALLALPIVVPEIVLASSLLLFFAALGLRLGFLTVILAHVAFCLSYVVVVVRARFAGLDPSLEEAAADLGAGPWRTFFQVTLPGIMPGVLSAALLVFALSVDDYVVTSFVAGVGSTTLPIQIYSMVRSGITPEINAISTLLLVATALLLLSAQQLERGVRARFAVLPALLSMAVLGAPFLGGSTAGPAPERVLNVYIWSNYIAPETVKKFEDRHRVRVNVDLYDTNEALLAKIQAGNTAYDVICPSNYPIQILRAQGLLLPLDHSALPNLKHLDPALLDRPYDPGNRHSVPYVWGTCGIGYNRKRTGPIDSWAALWDPRFQGRVLMLDDARETLGAALKRGGRSLNATDEGWLREAQRLLIQQKPIVKLYDSGSFDAALLSGDVWLAQGWSGQFAKVRDEDPDLEYVVPKEGGSLFVDSLAIPKGAPHPELAHAFVDFTMEPEIAAEICRTMQYSTPNLAAIPLLPASIRDNPAIFPPPDVMGRVELIEDIGEATVLYDRLWTEVKAER
jgi:spermidine/putrescine transport system permease protein